MPKTFTRSLFAAAFAIGLVCSANGAHAADAAPAKLPMVPAKPPSLYCANRVKDPAQNTQIPHQFMLLLVFQKGKGSSYFGNASTNQNGCIEDVQSVPNTAGTPQLLKPTGHYLTVPNCPNDCIYPRAAHAALNDGSDPLNTDKNRTIPWGIMSAVDSAPVDGGPGRRIEIWEVAVQDACHARRLYAYHTQCLNSLLRKALDRKDMLGEILVGYRVADNADGKTDPCPVINNVCLEK
ncbi:hypothetical protein HUX88_30265 [Duganella sp. BJB1802]|uniref:hypothetical protein n=1 Tax=Duganella sp. BJB1802 TaxID=2744575 RepID=UPI0015941DE2|nr:hypothetical protein [Duganella sp. BJB1802]NVD74776.1 hypothetical protein [Duganella sp. BJB1802]